MEIKIIKSLENTQKTNGLLVVIDVLRAFTTACFLINNGAKKIIAVADLEEAKKLKKENPDYILVGERKGLKVEGFDYGNSPAEIEKIDFKNKIIIFTTSRGTQSLEKFIDCGEIITGAFVNADAIVSFIKKSKPTFVSLVCTDSKEPDNEDYMLATYLKSRLENKKVDFSKIKKHLENHPCSDRFLRRPRTKFSRQDFYLCLDLNRFNFVLRAVKEKDLIFLKKN